MLRGLQLDDDERLIVGPRTLDDAGVVRLGQGEGVPAGTHLALVQTIDYFPPVVDDPWTYGAIAAANALSDVYAMGGRPFSALNIAAFPKDFPDTWMAEILRGGHDKMREAATLVVGGHTVQANEVQFGFAVTGFVDAREVRSNAGARAGDVLFLTKPLGAGALTTGAKQARIGWDDLAPAACTMARLNDSAAAAMNAAHAHAATDVTGFGLIGHAHNVAEASGVTLAFDVASLALYEGALALARQGVLSGSSARGRATLGERVHEAGGLERALVDVLYDAETSGGLLFAVDAGLASAVEADLAARGLASRPVGEVLARGAHAIALR